VAELTGAEFMLYCSIGGHEFVCRSNANSDYQAGQLLSLRFDMAKCHFFDCDSESVISDF